MFKSCMSCGEPLKGRSDKKFCCDQCRNAHNNFLNSDTTNYMRNINNILRKNRRILAELNQGKSLVPRDRLIRLGFNFNFHTDSTPSSKGKIYIFCYDQGYVELPNEMVNIIVRGET